MAPRTHLRIGGTRIALGAGGTIRDAADLLETVTRANLRALRDDPTLREEAVRRVCSPSCADRCYVRTGVNGTVSHDCHCPSGFQYAGDEDKEELEGCTARDSWSDLRSLIAGHKIAGRGPNDPIVCDCDDLGPSSLSVAAYLAWLAEKGAPIAGMPAIGAMPDQDARFAIAITRPPKADIAHLYGLTNRPPPKPQPLIRIGEWFVWDAAAHWGMKRPLDSFYTNPDAETVAFELRRDNLDGLRLR